MQTQRIVNCLDAVVEYGFDKEDMELSLVSVIYIQSKIKVGSSKGKLVQESVINGEIIKARGWWRLTKENINW